MDFIKIFCLSIWILSPGYANEAEPSEEKNDDIKTKGKPETKLFLICFIRQDTFMTKPLFNNEKI